MSCVTLSFFLLLCFALSFHYRAGGYFSARLP